MVLGVNRFSLPLLALPEREHLVLRDESRSWQLRLSLMRLTPVPPLPSVAPAAEDSASPEPVTAPPASPATNLESTVARESRPHSDVVPAAPPVDPLILAAAESKFRGAVSHFSRADWAREQQLEFESNACIRYLLLGSPATLPPDFFEGVPSHRRTPLSDIKELADKSRLLVDDGFCLLVRKPTKPPARPADRPGGRFARLLNDEPVRIYVPMRMRPWVMLAIHAMPSAI